LNQKHIGHSRVTPLYQKDSNKPSSEIHG